MRNQCATNGLSVSAGWSAASSTARRPAAGEPSLWSRLSLTRHWAAFCRYTVAFMAMSKLPCEAKASNARTPSPKFSTKKSQLISITLSMMLKALSGAASLPGSCTAARRMLKTIFQPDLTFWIRVKTIEMEETISSLTSRLALSLVITTSKGFKNSTWRLEAHSWSSSRKLFANCFMESMAYMPTLTLGWLAATSTKCLLSTSQIGSQTSRGRLMLHMATSTSFWSAKIRGCFTISSSILETPFSAVTK
mmetsp:Transcript_32343/g.84848  ORF Transcript_32343/g.84848 Transcript_32343/m.84848 type:complete len:250 (-) Transcript_32343:1165-1914(-)